MSWISSALRALILLAAVAAGTGRAEAKGIPGLAGEGRAWAALLIEDHQGMQEVVWDAAFTELSTAGPFLKDHSYVIRTGSTPQLLDLGCWDAASARGGECHGLTATYTLTWASDRKGVILRAGNHATWLPVLGGFDGDEVPCTFRGAYLNWLLLHRSATPSIPSETRWQRVQRGAMKLAEQLLARRGGKPAYRLVGIGTSGHLLIPPGEGLAAVQHAIQRMMPRVHDGEGGHDKDDDRDRDKDCDRDGSMLKALQKAYESVAQVRGSDREGDHHRQDGDDDHGDRDHDDDHDEGHHGGTPGSECSLDLVIPVSDGMAFGRTCDSARAYEALSSYGDMVKMVGRIAATGRAAVWPWNVEGPGLWDKAFATAGGGRFFEGDAIPALLSAVADWMAHQGSAPVVTLSLSNPVLTRIPNELLTVTLSREATSATLNGQPLSLTGLVTTVPLTLVEGANAFTVVVQSPCGSTQANLSVVLDTVAPVLTIQSPAEGWRTNASTVTLSGRVDDATAILTVNGQPLAQTSGAFTATFTPPEGPFAITVTATDPAGNASALTRTILVDRTAPKITLAKPIPALTSATSLGIQGQVDDPTASFTLNGQPVALNAQGGFSASLPLVEGSNAIALVAVDAAGNIGRLEAAVTRDTVAPALRFTEPVEGLVTNAHSLNLVGQVDDLGATVLVGGLPMTLDASGTFRTVVATSEGPMTFSATATDAAGNTSQASRSILVDWTAPVIVLDTAPPKLISAVAYTFAGKVDDPKAIFKVNGQGVPLDAEGRFSFSLPLVEGANTVHMEAADAAGNVGTLDAALTRDTLAPRIILSKPVPPLTGNAKLDIQGVVDDPSAILTFGGAVVPMDTLGAFSLSLTLAEGPNGFTFQAQDPAGNVGTLTVVTALDTQAPVLKVLAPIEGLRTNAAQIAVTGSVDDPLAQVKVNGQTAALDGTGAFSLPISPAEGALTFVVTATDPVGNQSQETRHIIVDRTAPRITLTTPVPTLTNQAALGIQGIVDDPSAALTLNGQTVALDAAGAFTISTQLAVEGVNVLHFEAADGAGNVGTLDAQVALDTAPPVITLSSALLAVTKATTLDLSGSVSEAVATMTLNGAALPFSGQTFSVQAPLSVEGNNSFEITATDLAGNVGRLTVSTIRDTTAPVIRFESPQDGFTTRETTVTVRGTVDDPAARLVLQGAETPLDAQGHFEATVSGAKEGALAIQAEATDAVGNTGKGTLFVRFDFTPPVLAWAEPTPASGAVLATSVIPVGVVINEAALTSINGARMELEPSENPSMPYLARTEVTVVEGQAVLSATAVDGAGNSATIERTLAVGLTQPRIVLEAPALDGARQFSTANPGVVLQGHVDAPDLVKPLRFSVNGQIQPLTPDGRFSVPLTLSTGLNPITLVATTNLGQTDTQALTVLRTSQEVPAEAPVTVQIDWPQNGFASGVTPILVKGRVNKPGVQVTLAGQAATVDPQTLQFAGNVALTQGANRIQAVATDAAGQSGQAEVQGVYLAPGSAKYAWEAPLDGSHSATRMVAISGQADQPGILSISVNGLPMTLQGDGALGRFSGEVPLPSAGRNSLLMEVHTLAGETRTERRDVIFEPALPRIRLLAPDSARPGDTISIQVSPEADTKLVKADLSWNGRFLASLTDPFAAVNALVPADAVVGSRISVEALGTDAEGATVTARTYVTVYGTGALMIEAYDDSLGLPLTDKTATASVEGGESQALDGHGRAALATALPQNWVKVAKPGFTPVWRSAALQVGGAQSLMDARLTPMASTQEADASGFTGLFAAGVLKLTVPAGALTGPGKMSVTPLSSQGLPGLLPFGWSAASAWWIQLDAAALSAPGSVALALPAATPALPADARFTWARWDENGHVWMVLAAGLAPDALGNLPLPAMGGYALLLGDSGATAPPVPLANSVLAGFEGTTWQDGLAASGSVDPSVMPTVAAIRGARATAKFGLDFQGANALPSGVPIQVDVLESYALLDSAVIEPDGFSQDAVASRWMLEVVDGQPVLTGAGDGLGLRLPVRMSRTFGEADLVDGRIWVGFYHDGMQVAQSGSELLGASGGEVVRDGVKVAFPTGALSGTTLVRLSVDAGDATPLWPELGGKGTVAKSFTVDIVGTLLAGLGLSLEAPDLPDTARPLVLQRRVVQGERLVVAVGELQKQGSIWTLATGAGGNPILDGGSFAVLVPTQTWNWISGTALLPASVAQPLMAKLGTKARMVSVKRLNPSLQNLETGAPHSKPAAVPASASADDVAVADVVVDGGFLLSVSGANGAFAVPAVVPVDATPVPVKGERRDLGVTGALTATVPSAGNTLRLATVPFRVLNAVPVEGATAPVGSIAMLMLSVPADPASIINAKLFKDAEVSVRRSLSQDGKTIFLTPDQLLDQASSYRIVADGLLNLGGEKAPLFESHFQTAAVSVQPSEVDFSRIKLSYPDDSFTVTVTVPEGALPPRAVAELEANGMGSYGNGTMPGKGDLVFTLKAALGERIKIRVQLKDGRVFEGYLSRYESNDGSGKVTLGIDGGRVEAADGQAAATFPEGALDGPAEVQVVFTKDLPAELDPTVASQEKIVGRIQLRTSQEGIQLKKRPLLEILAPENASTAQHTDGLGAYAVFDRVEGFEEDGTPCTYFELSDTAALSGTMLKSMGGLPQTLSLSPDGPSAPASLKALPLINTVMGPGRGTRREVASRTTSLSPITEKARGTTSSGVKPVRETPAIAGFFGGFGLFGLMDALMIDSGPHYIGGFADISIPGQPTKPAIGAFVNFSKTGNIKRGGQMLQRTTAPAGSYLLASFLTDELIRGGGEIMGIDADFGVHAFSGTSFGGPGGVFGTYFHAPTLHFMVEPSQMGDHQPPYEELSFFVMDPSGSYRPIEVANVGDAVYAVIKTHDNQTDFAKLVMDLKIDSIPHPQCHGDCSSPNWGSLHSMAFERGLAVYRFKVDNLTPGKHSVVATVYDQACNSASQTKELTVLSFGSDLPSIPGVAPTASLEVQGDLTSVRTDSTIRVKFSEPVTGVSTASLLLERLENGTFVSETARLFGRLGEMTASQSVSEVMVLPLSPLKPGTTYQVRFTDVIQDSERFKLQSGPLGFATTSYVNYPKQVIPAGRIADIAAIGNMAYVGVGEKIQSWIYEGDTWLSQGLVGPGPDGGFFGQDIVRIRAFPDAALGKDALGNEEKGSLLLVTTTPKDWQSNYQSVLWGYRACEVPELLFAVSLGQGASAYSPSVDYRDGIIAVGRLTSSVALIDVKLARDGWRAWISGGGSQGMVYAPYGVNQRSIIQPFYMTDPDGASVPAAWGVGLLPTSAADTTGTGLKIAVAVGFLGEGMRGMPNSIQTGDASNWIPQPAFIGPKNGVDARAVARSLTDGRGVTRLAVVPGIEITDADGSNPRTTNLAVGLSSSTRLYIVDELDPAHPVELGYWDAPGTILYRMSAVDEISKWVAVPVNKPEGLVWHILSLRVPSKPTVIAELKGLGVTGAMSYGVLYTVGDGVMSAVDFNQQTPSPTSTPVKMAPVALDEARVLGEKVITSIKSAGVVRPLINVQKAKPSLKCVVAPKITIDLITINQAVERNLEDNSKTGIPWTWKRNVPRVGGRPAVIRIYASKAATATVNGNVAVKLVVSAKVGGVVIEKTFYDASKHKNQLSAVKGNFGDLNYPGLFVYTLSKKDEFQMLNPSTKIKLLVEPDPADNINPAEIKNSYADLKATPFTYSRMMNIHLLPVTYTRANGQPSETLSSGDLAAFKTRYEESIRAIMPLTLCDETGRERLNVQINPKGIPSPVWPEYPNGNHPSLDGHMQTTANPTQGWLEHWWNDLCFKPSAPYASISDESTYKVLLIRYHQGVTCKAGEPGGISVDTGRVHLAAVYVDPGLANWPTHEANNAIHELGHMLGSAHAPVVSMNGALFDDLDTLNDFKIGLDWKNNFNIHGNPYYFARIGVPGNNFSISSVDAGVAVNAGWRSTAPSQVPADDRDIMGYGNDATNWVSDYNFEQWWNHNSSAARPYLRRYQRSAPARPKITVTISPTAGTIPINGTLNFTATVRNATNTAVDWIADYGTVTSTGVYTASSSAGPAMVQASHHIDSRRYAIANVKVLPVLTITPANAVVKAGETQAFTVQVAGTTDQHVSWTVTDGAIDAAGSFTAPLQATTVQLTAESIPFPGAKVTVPIRILPKVQISPVPAISVNSTSALTATVLGCTDATVQWTASAGTIDAAGNFKAPPVPQTVVVTATSVAYPESKGTLSIAVVPAPPGTP